MAFQTFKPIEYVKMDVAANFGLDKENWDVRLAWFEDNIDRITELAQFHQQIEVGKLSERAISDHPLVKEADEPALFYAGVRAWHRAGEGKSINYPVSQDATASGAQIMAALMCCRDSAEMCNVVDTGQREDFYTWTHQAMLNRTSEKSMVSRSQLKNAVMPWFYYSTKEPKKVFGEGALLHTFYDTMDDEAPGVVEARQILAESWQPYADVHHWKLPDNFHVYDRVEDIQKEDFLFDGEPGIAEFKVQQGKERGISLAANGIHSVDGFVVREVGRRADYDREQIINLMAMLTADLPSYLPTKKRPQDELVEILWEHYEDSGFLSARILELLDEENIHLVDRAVVRELLCTLPNSPFKVITVHDCFRVHPNYANDLRRIYNRVLYEIARSDLFSFIVSQIQGRYVPIEKFDTTLPNDILESNYALS